MYKGRSDSSGGCYLTSACVYAKGLPDDCHELTVLRGYRDGWLRTAPEGEALIEQYYKEAPRIVSNINERSDQKSIYEKIYEEVVCPCVEYIENNEMKGRCNFIKTWCWI
ncbi:CFI-box-CTERM domain-containing protein [Anaerobutyricum hallii]|uniref:CFI-box-CTERM domain-containing protein n=1 Tax=Anaerobutyricum hallii TaxID=39488 RepID=UPI003A7F58EA